ncbi:hypothetical protein CBS101457_000963 [Exobasidium rhododendri]|nr:hypothetical protein CBS101457_000963 [Exobasidium rhododendri]
MSYSWTVGSDRSNPLSGEASAKAMLGSAAVEQPLTPPSVRNVNVSTCLNISQFRALMQEYRSLDDLVTTRLNRTLSNSRTSGFTHSPSLLSTHITSNTSDDLGKSTYSRAPEQACLSFWNELVNVWIGREEVLEYCMKVEERERLQKLRLKAGEEWILNNDIEKKSRESGFGKTGWGLNRAKGDPFDSRASRSEDSGESLRRQMKNEFAVEAIIRKRSLDVFKSKCRFFSPTFSEGIRGEHERSMWNGVATPAAQQAQQ